VDIDIKKIKNKKNKKNKKKKRKKKKLIRQTYDHNHIFNCPKLDFSNP
jgi:hypothetical protein